MDATKKLTAIQAGDLIEVLRTRFQKHLDRHSGIVWDEVATRLVARADKLWSLNEMERTGGEPDVVGYDQEGGEFTIIDCSAESPKGRRGVCYDEAALAARKKFPPNDSAMNMAAAMGVEILNEDQYRELQKIGEFDLKTSSWLKTPAEIRKHGGAIFGDRRYDHVFTYHNGADSYYAARGFRGWLKV